MALLCLYIVVYKAKYVRACMHIRSVLYCIASSRPKFRIKKAFLLTNSTLRYFGHTWFLAARQRPKRNGGDDIKRKERDPRAKLLPEFFSTSFTSSRFVHFACLENATISYISACSQITQGVWSSPESSWKMGLLFPSQEEAPTDNQRFCKITAETSCNVPNRSAS